MESNNRTASAKNSKIDSIQVLRGIAAVIVAVYHLKYLATDIPAFSQTLDFFFNSGAAGVILFFVISGFIMVYITGHKTFDPKDVLHFLIKRFVRIWPTYVLITLLFAFLTYRYQIGYQASQIIRSILFIPLTDDNPPFYGYATLSVGWSLNYEIYFYFLVGISLLFTKYRWVVFFLLVTITLVVIPQLAGHFTTDPIRHFNFGNPYINMITNPIIWNFVYGVVIGLLFITPLSNRFSSRIFSSFTLVITVTIIVVWQYLSGFFGGQGPLQWGIGSGLLFLAVLFYSSSRVIQFPQWLVRLGDISFSIYLLHLPVKLLIETIFQRVGYPLYGTGSAMFFLTMSMTIICSVLSHKYLELKFSSYVKNLFLPDRRKSVGRTA